MIEADPIFEIMAFIFGMLFIAVVVIFIAFFSVPEDTAATFQDNNDYVKTQEYLNIVMSQGLYDDDLSQLDMDISEQYRGMTLPEVYSYGYALENDQDESPEIRTTTGTREITYEEVQGIGLGHIILMGSTEPEDEVRPRFRNIRFHDSEAYLEEDEEVFPGTELEDFYNDMLGIDTHIEGFRIPIATPWGSENAYFMVDTEDDLESDIEAEGVFS